MKINNIVDTTPALTPSTPRPAGSTGQPVEAVPPSSSVTLSTLSSRLAGVESGLKSLDVSFDAAKVASVKARVEDGSYQINAGRIADAMLSQIAQSASAKVQ